MNEAPPTLQEVAHPVVGDATFLEVMIILAKHKGKLFGVPLAAGVLAYALSFAMPNIYKASTKLLPPQQAQSGASALLSQLGGIAGLAGAGGLKNPSDVYVGMLKSRVIANKLISKYDLKRIYGTDSLEKARVDLESSTVITVGKDGLITIEVEGEQQQLVPQIANAYVSELIALSKTFAITEAGQRRMFFESQLELAKNNLTKAEASLKGALDTGGVISVDSDSRAVVETVARLRAQISAREVELNAMRPFVTATNPSFRRVEEGLNSLRAELSKLENGRAASTTPQDKFVGKNAGLENIQLLRDLKYYQMLYELLAKQYEAARLDEAKDPAVIQVLDIAVAPERKFKPKRGLIVAVTGLFSFLAVLLLVFVGEARRKSLAVPEYAHRWGELRRHLRLR